MFTTDLTDLTLAEGAAVSLDADATDADGDALTYAASGLPAGITIDSGTGVISGTLGSTTAGTYDVSVTVSDGSLADTDTFRLTVTNTNHAPVFSTDLQDRHDSEGAAVSMDADATDADGDSLTYSASGLPAGVSIDPATGVISGTLASGSAGVHNVTVTVSDGTLTDTTRSSGRSTAPTCRRPRRRASRRGLRTARSCSPGRPTARPTSPATACTARPRRRCRPRAPRSAARACWRRRPTPTPAW